MEGAATVGAMVAAEDVEEADIPEDSLEDTADSLVDIPEDSLDVGFLDRVGSLVAEDFPVAIEDLVAADLATIRRSAAPEAMAEGDIEVVTVGGIMEGMLRDIIMEDTTIPADTMVVITGTTIEAMPRTKQLLGFFLAG